jgi:hypothetical protein
VRRDKKPLWRWIGEAALIFLSILAAFYVDNYRDQKAQEVLYLKHLKDFQYDLKSNIGSMTFELEREGEAGQSGYLTADMLLYDSLEAIIYGGNASQMPEAMELLSTYANQRLSKWIFESPHFNKLTVDYYYYIKNPELKSSIVTHKKDNLHRHEAKDQFNTAIRELQLLTDNLDFKNPQSRQNREVLFSNQMLNKVTRLTRSYLLLKNLTELNRDRDNLILNEVEKELDLW